MPSTSLETACPTTTTQTERANRPVGWVKRLIGAVRRQTPVLAAAAMVGLGVSTADAQMQAAPVYASPDAGPGAIMPNPPPPGAMAWPQISPYHQSNVLSTSHVNRGGLWLQEITQKNREYYFSAEATRTNFGKAGSAPIGAAPLNGALNVDGQLESGQISNPGVPFNTGTTGQATVGLIVDGTADLFPQLPIGFVLSGPGVFPYPFISDDAAPVPGDLNAAANSLLFPVRTLDILGDGEATGTRLTWGFDNGDGSGVEIRGWWSGNARSEFRRGQPDFNGVPFNPVNVGINLTALVDLQSGGIPLENGLPTFPAAGTSLGITGSTQKYDLFYSAFNKTEVSSLDFTVLARSLYENDAFRIRLTGGLSYLYVDESFHFRGIDSGLSYDVSDFQSSFGTLPSGNTGGGGGGNNISPRLTQAPTVATPVATNTPNQIIDAQLDAHVDSHLAGPTVGTRYEFGRGKWFRLHGETTFGLFVNHERNRVNSRNIAEQEHSKTFHGLDFLSVPRASAADPLVLRPDDFAVRNDARDHTTLSPMFRQSFKAEVAMPGLIPILRKSDFFEDAFLTAGYTYMVLGNVQRPGEAIFWRGYNGVVEESFPTARSARSSFDWHEFNIGFEWNY